MTLRASCPRSAHRGDPCDTSSLGGASSGVISLPSAKCQYPESLSPLKPCSAPLLATSDSNVPEHSAELEAEAPLSILDQQSKLSKVTWESRVSLDGRVLEPQFPYLTKALTGSLPCKVRGCPGATLSRVQLILSAGC